MSKQKLNMEDLDKVAGGYITGTIDGEPLTVTGSGDSYTVTVGGDPGQYTRQQVIDFVNELAPEPLKPQEIDQMFAYIESSQPYDIGDW